MRVEEPFLRDTVNVGFWDGKSASYPRVKLRMDFRSPRLVGTFVYHCHLLEHEDGGMMGTIHVVTDYQGVAVRYVLAINGVFLSGGFERSTQIPTPKGAPFYICVA